MNGITKAFDIKKLGPTERLTCESTRSRVLRQFADPQEVTSND